MSDTALSAQELANALGAAVADLNGYIARKAEALAGPAVAEAEADCLVRIGEAQADAQRWKDVNTELQRRMRPLEKCRDEATEARRRLGIALGHGPHSAIPLRILVDEAAKALEARRGDE